MMASGAGGWWPGALGRQSPYNWGKSTQSFISIAIRPIFASKRCSSSPPKNESKRMVRPYVKISLDQYEQLDRLRKERKESLSKLIREALLSFTKKKEHSISALLSFLPACTKDKYKTVTAYFPRHEWDLLRKISKNTGRCKTELLRKAVEQYLNQVKSTKDWICFGKTQGSNSVSWESHPHWESYTSSRQGMCCDWLE